MFFNLTFIVVIIIIVVGIIIVVIVSNLKRKEIVKDIFEYETAPVIYIRFLYHFVALSLPGSVTATSVSGNVPYTPLDIPLMKK